MNTGTALYLIHFLTFRHYKGGRSPAKRTGRLYPRRNPWYSFSEAESTSGHMVLSGVPRKKIPSDTTGNRSRDRPTSSAVIKYIYYVLFKTFYLIKTLILNFVYISSQTYNKGLIGTSYFLRVSSSFFFSSCLLINSAHHFLVSEQLCHIYV